MRQIEGGGIAKYEELNNRRANQDSPAGCITQQSQKLLDAERKYASEYQAHQSNLLRKRRSAIPRKITQRMAMPKPLRRITGHTSPARKMLCSMATK